MLKKVMSAVLAMFVCFCAIGFIGSADYDYSDHDDSTTDYNYDGSTTDYYYDDNDEYSNYDDGEYSNYYDSTTDSYYDYDENCDGSTTDSSYDSSNANVYRNDGLPPGRQCKKWAEYQKNLAKQQNNQSGNKSDQANVYEEKSDNSSDDDFDFYLDRKRVREEQLQEDEDLKDMDKEAVWGK